jgi:HEAT repeat protein
MLTCAATNVCRCGGTVLAVLLAACAGTEVPPFRPAALTPEQAQLCRDAEQAYRNGAPEYEALRQRVAADPTASAWLTRMFVRDVFAAREGRPIGEGENDPTVRADAQADPRAVTEIVALGAAAVPVLVGDLLANGQPQPRELGVELLARVGAPAVSAVLPLAASGDARQRRSAGRALGAIGAAGDVLPALRRLATDEDFTVRADALAEIHDGGEPARALLCERLRDDDDAFVRRIAAKSLAHFRDRAAATALVDYLERCKRDGDHRGEMAAQASLQAIARTRGPRTPAVWRAFAQTL